MMKEMICPTCGKTNPADQMICQFCHTRLAATLHENEAENFPDWLEELRPGAMSAEETQGRVANKISILGASPLEGLQGVIQAEPDFPVKRKPPVYNDNFQPSERQQAHALLFSQVIRSEGSTGPLAVRPISKSQNILRLIVAITLFLTIVIAAIAPSQEISAPNILNFPETLAAFQLVENISAGQAVLFVVDFQTSAAGEMDAVAGVILQHLVSRNARLVFVSTNTMGPMQAERLMQKANQTLGSSYKPLENYANLGYIPGGLAGILGFIQSPQRTLPVSSDSYLVWEEPSFHLLNDITDFSLVVVSSEQTDIARSWIEQLEPYLTDTPLILAVSAQLEPVMMAYYQALPKQIHGLVSGWASATAYTSISYNPGNGKASWAPFSYAGLMSVILIILIGGYNSLSRIKLDKQSRKPVLKEEEL